MQSARESSMRLLRLVANSERRSRIVLMLTEKPKSLTELSESLSSSPSNVLPQIRKLEAAGLVSSERGLYSLTEFGRMVAELFSGFVDGMEVVEEHRAFWVEHDTSGIPGHLLRRLHELSGARVVTNPPESVYDPHREFIENVSSSRCICGISPVYHPAYPTMFAELARGGREIELILSHSVLEKVRENNPRELEEYLEQPNAKLYVVRNRLRVAMVVTDRYFSLSLYFKNGIYDTARDLVGFSESSLMWGRDLFEHYLQQAERVEP
ncbi:MAG: winged helix-turn-helix domain-containing protein, partial [Euryarchaeota archaeon]|nr:winged helix-turn-helix domain-containing protein [Euryarchaeota archaeon]